MPPGGEKVTDTRLPDHWLLNPTLDKLSDGAWRVLTRALMWCNQQGTDGEIESLYMRYLYPFDDPSAYLEELVEIGWLERTEKGFLIPDWEGKGQATAAQVNTWRQNARLRQQRSREKKRVSQSQVVTSEVTRDVGQEQEQDRTGQDYYGKPVWPAVASPGSAGQLNGE